MKIKESVMELLEELKCLQSFLEVEFSHPSNLSWKKRLPCIFRGFYSKSYHLLDFDHNDYHDYLPDFYRYKLGKINKPYQFMLNDKYIFSKVMADTGWSAKVFGSISGGKVRLNNEYTNYSELIELVKREGVLIIKAVGLGGGQEIHKLIYEGGALFVDGETIEVNQLASHFDKNIKYVICEFLKHGSYSDDIYSGATNTIRFVTMKDRISGDVYIPAAMHKFGTVKSGHRDNISSGGIACLLDLKTGEVLNGNRENNGRVEPIKKHPDTKKRIVGIRIPNWEMVVREVKKLAASLDNIYYVGWDIVVQDDGIKVIEGNNNPDLDYQCTVPLLRDKHIVHFLRQNKVIK